MRIHVSRTTLGTTCECGEPALPGVFSVQVIGDGTGQISQSAAEPMALCGPCALMASDPSEHALGVLVVVIGN